MRIDSNTISNLAVTAACAVVVVLGGMQIWDRVTMGAPQPPNAVTNISPVDVSVANAPVQGNKNAMTAIVEFSDFQCPFCGRYARDTYEDLKREFVTSGKIRYAFVNFPLPNHQYAEGAAEAAECAHAQGRFWPMHDRLFSRQNLLGPADLAGHAREIGLDPQAFQSCLAGKPLASVSRDIEMAKRVGIESTPTFLIGIVKSDGTVHVTKKIVGAQPPDVFRQALKELIRG